MSSMVTASMPVRTAILSEVAGKDIRPGDLLLALGNKGYAESDIKQALSALLRDGLIELTSQRMLKPATSQDAA